ncbi:MAG TPA: enoyl-CoA hydratase-related protein [Hypericibacter adhaerens]|uniref:2-(1,2-epoxy-1,2-dihydrophenyl)acetyl-CoA isomerase n=1 Tax=Hypericibacter adhaerens TaxID=2602016 RepID=A0A5J6N5L1_9PROT|nr:enoyl-CoA hydratase-related protein [Hypericibacter adhaerens]QEX23850.1 2-(1,2-epoxy-1,2-dihydrophenyl)acetyl-CoA isomerase [Hypericibacter adhaerens]HWA43119.1 enoyl-CoA hydratase-related protein [Hypericibacter adhaerens]
MTGYRTILFERKDAVARITLNRPDKLNSFTGGMLSELQAALAEVAADPGLRALVLAGSGRAFGAGQDLREAHAVDSPAAVGEHLARYYDPAMKKLAALEIPTLASVNGIAAGASCGLALGCDLIVAARSATFLMAFARIGLVPDGGSSYWLPRRVGLTRALGMTLLAEPVTAEQAERWGLIWECVDDDALASRTEALAQQLANGPTRAYALAKRAFHGSGTNSFEQQLALEAELQALAVGTADAREGIAAFLEKRTAKFSGR